MMYRYKNIYSIFHLELSKLGYLDLETMFEQDPARFERIVKYIAGSLVLMKKDIVNYGIDIINTYAPKDTGNLRGNLIGWLSASDAPGRGDIYLYSLKLTVFFDTNLPHGRIVNEFNTRKSRVVRRKQVMKYKNSVYKRRTPHLRHNMSEKIKGASGQYLHDPKARKHFMQYISKLLIKKLNITYRRMLFGINRNVPELTLSHINSWFTKNEKTWVK